MRSRFGIRRPATDASNSPLIGAESPACASNRIIRRSRTDLGTRFCATRVSKIRVIAPIPFRPRALRTPYSRSTSPRRTRRSRSAPSKASSTRSAGTAAPRSISVRARDVTGITPTTARSDALSRRVWWTTTPVRRWRIFIGSSTSIASERNPSYPWSLAAVQCDARHSGPPSSTAARTSCCHDLDDAAKRKTDGATRSASPRSISRLNRSLPKPASRASLAVKSPSLAALTADNLRDRRSVAHVPSDGWCHIEGRAEEARRH